MSAPIAEAAAAASSAPPAGPVAASRAGEPAILELSEVTKRFRRHEDTVDRMLRRLTRRPPPPTVHAVDRVSLRVARGEVVGIVGESGCGKSTLARVAAGIAQPSEGTVLTDGRPVSALSGREAVRARLRIQMVFQDPFASLDPRMRVEDILTEGALAHGLANRAERQSFAEAQLRRVELDPAVRRRFPHQFSGGQRQRIAIARALSVSPELVICDEAVAALDVSIQAQIINLFMDLRERLGLAYLFLSHDLGVIEHVCDRVVVMYLGRVVEEAPVDDLFARPNHPYTRALLAERPRIHTARRTYAALQGELPSPLSPPSGCHFHTRCPHAFARCREEAPRLRTVGTGHRSACHLDEH